MNFYIFTILFFIWLYGAYLWGSATGQRKTAIFLICLFLWFFMAFRHEVVGLDTIPYLNFSNWIQENSHDIFLYDQTRFEFLYVYFNWLVLQCTDWTFAIIPISSCLIIAPIGIIIYKYSKNYLFSFLLYYLLWFYFFALSGIRQSIAISLTMVAFVLLTKKKHWWCLLFILLAYLFHKSAIVFLLIMFLPYVPIPSLYLYTLFIITLTVLNNTVIKKIFFPLIGLYEGNSIYFVTAVKNFNLASACFLLQYLIIIFLCHLIWKKKSDDNPAMKSPRFSGDYEMNSLMLKALMVGGVFICASITMTILMRLTYYFTIYAILLLPGCTTDKKWRNLSFFLIIVFLVILIVIEVFRSYWLGIFPYYLYWNDVDSSRYYLYENINQ